MAVMEEVAVAVQVQVQVQVQVVVVEKRDDDGVGGGAGRGGEEGGGEGMMEAEEEKGVVSREARGAGPKKEIGKTEKIQQLVVVLSSLCARAQLF